MIRTTRNKRPTRSKRMSRKLLFALLVLSSEFVKSINSSTQEEVTTKTSSLSYARAVLARGTLPCSSWHKHEYGLSLARLLRSKHGTSSMPSPRHRYMSAGPPPTGASKPPTAKRGAQRSAESRALISGGGWGVLCFLHVAEPQS